MGRSAHQGSPGLQRGAGGARAGAGVAGAGEAGKDGGVSGEGGDACLGRRVYIHQLPQKFNQHLLVQKEDYSEGRRQWYTEQMLRVLERVSENEGFGKPIESPPPESREHPPH